MTITAEEQYLIELINRARLDPEAEAARYGIDLNKDLSPGTLQGGSRPVLAPNTLLEQAAIGHSQWMLAADVFSHTGSGGSSVGTRVNATGYSWSALGENISWTGTTGTLNMTSAIASQHAGLFNSAGHRLNILNGSYREIGTAQEYGQFTHSSGITYNASMLTEVFGRGGSQVFVTGVAYDDSDRNSFYSIGEGVGGAQFSSGGTNTSTAGAGGYALGVTAAAATVVNGSVGGQGFSVTLDTRAGNVKLDVVDGDTFRSSGTTTLGSGIDNLELLGTLNLRGTGNANANEIVGNTGNNRLAGGNGNDSLSGGDGKDTVLGGQGNDDLLGGTSRDALRGQGGADSLRGDGGNDWISGDGGNDTLNGGTGADRFVFKQWLGQDTVEDFSIAQGDRLRLDDAIWGGTALTDQQVIDQFAQVTAAGVLIEFNARHSILLEGLTTTVGLADQIDIF